MHIDSKTLEVVEEGNTKYKVLAVPIKFNKNYTVAIDSYSSVYIAPVLYDKSGLVVSIVDNERVSLTTFMESHNKRYQSARFLQPFKVSITTNEKRLYDSERNLYLLIQVHNTNDSSLVVIEGDYTNMPNQRIYDAKSLLQSDSALINSLLISPLSLLQLNDHNIYAYSDRLIEYLLLNVVDENDEINNNIARVQEAFDIKYEHSKGVWDNKLREWIFKKSIRNDDIPKLDLLGYVDKSVERYVMPVKDS
jgi:hypothetical protein